jgi:hypothetical protein|tara:strand:+ start:1447 stop:4299 length:2853 start_codon:yes stop_codon:yes gene_type:complete
MKKLILLPLLIATLHGKETHNVLPQAASDWKQAGPGSFTIANNISTAKGGMGLWWYGKKEFKNACFEIEFNAPEDADNSGVFVRFPDPGKDPWVAVKKGYEIQIGGNASHKNKTGAIYNIQAGIHPNVKVGEWNTYKIITAGDQIAVILNDKLINVFECQAGRGDVSGYFGLQNHDDGSPVQFRNVKVHELSSSSLLSAMSELEIPRSALTEYATAAASLKGAPKQKWYHLSDHGPAFFQTYGDWFKGKERRESAIKGIALSYSALPNRVALFNIENLSLVSATDKGLNLLNTPWGNGHGRVNQFNNKDSYLFTADEGSVWADESGSFEDKRPLKGYGNFSHLEFNGYFRNGNQVILDYSVNGTRILDTVSDHNNGLVRYLEVAPHKKELTVRLLDSSSEKTFALKTSAVDGSIKSTNKGGTHILSLEPSDKTTKVALLYTGNPAEEMPAPIALTPMTKGGASISPETFEVEVKVSGGDSPWLVDQVPLPPAMEKSPYKGKVRMSDIDFFSDGDSALLSTWDGDIWHLSGLKEFKKLTWKRYATGFFEPLGLKIVKDVPYISGRDGIYKTYDLNNDGEADKFEVFNNDVYLSNNFHEFQFGLETDKEGNFYFAKASPVLRGGRGFDKILPHNGAFVKISADGKRFDTIGTGLRAPGGIGIGPNGEITSGENEGTWQPRCKINYYEPKRGIPFFGVEDTRQGNKTEFTEPLCYLPMSVDNSGGGQIWVEKGAKIGIAEGELIHLSYGKSAIYHVLRQKVSDGFYQGGVVKLPVKLSSSAQRAVFHPDGSMYVVGFRGWQTNAATEAGLQRIRRNQDEANPLPSAMEVTKDGIKLTFDVELDAELANDPTSFSSQRWKYVRGPQYGSGQFSVDNPDKAAEENAIKKESKKHRKPDTVAITAAKLGADKKSVLLTVEGHKPSQQFKLEYDLESTDGDEFIGTIYSTIHKVPGT